MKHDRKHLKNKVFALLIAFCVVFMMAAGTSRAASFSAAGIEGGETGSEISGEAEEKTGSDELAPSNAKIKGEEEEPSKAGGVAKVGDTEYATLEEAISGAASGSVITLLDNISVTRNNGFDIPSGKSLTLDLAGKTIAVTAPDAKVSYAIKNSGSLVVKDSASGGKITLSASQPTTNYGYASNVISNYGSLSVQSGNISNPSSGPCSYGIDNYPGGTLNMSGGTVQSANCSGIRMFCNSTTANNTVNISGGTVKGGFMGLQLQLPNANANKGTINITGGTFVNPDWAVYAGSGSDGSNVNVSISGGTFTGDVAFGGSIPGSNLSVTGGLFEGTYGCYSYSEDCEPFISGGVFTGEYAENETDPFVIQGSTLIPVEGSEDEYVVGKLVEIVVEPKPGQSKRASEKDPSKFEYIIKDNKGYSQAAKLIKCVLTREEAGNHVPGEYKLTFKTLKEGYDNTNLICFVPVASEKVVNFTVLEDLTDIKLTSKDGKVTAVVKDVPVSEDMAVFEANDDIELYTKDISDSAIKKKVPSGNKLILCKEIHFVQKSTGDEVAVPDGLKVDLTFNVGKDYNQKKGTVLHNTGDSVKSVASDTIKNGKISAAGLTSLSPFGVYVNEQKSGGSGAKTGENGRRYIIALIVMLVCMMICGGMLVYAKIKGIALFGRKLAAADASAGSESDGSDLFADDGLSEDKEDLFIDISESE